MAFFSLCNISHLHVSTFQDRLNDIHDLENSLAAFPMKPLRALKYKVLTSSDFGLFSWNFDLETKLSCLPFSSWPKLSLVTGYSSHCSSLDIVMHIYFVLWIIVSNKCGWVALVFDVLTEQYKRCSMCFYVPIRFFEREALHSMYMPESNCWITLWFTLNYFSYFVKGFSWTSWVSIFILTYSFIHLSMQ